MSINSGATYTKSQSVTLNFSVTSASQMYITNSLGCNADGSWENYTASKSWNLGQANNTATVYAKFKDAFGSETSCINSTIIHDNIAPTNASISINGGASYVTTTTVALSLTATGATDMYITNTAGCISDGTWESYATTRSWTIGQTNATATVYAKFRDAASNEGTCVSDTIIHDNTPPANTSISINSDAIFTTSSRPLALSFTATDINPIQMYVTNTSGCASGGNWENFTSSKSWDVGPICTSKCTGTAYVKFADAAGNESSCISDTITKVWLEINLPQQARYGIAATSVGTKAFFAGGHIYAPPYITNRIDIYDSSTNSWSTASLSQARYNAVAVTVGTKAIFAGGRTSDSGNAVTDRVDIYDSSTNSWSTASLSWSRDTLAATSVGTKAIFGPGIGVSGVQDTVDIYDSSNNTWSQTTIPQTGYGMAATSVGAKAIFAGGSPSGNAVNIYDPSTNSWSTTILSQSRTYLAAVTVGTKAIFAGGNNGSSASNRVDIYDSTTNSWSTTTLSVARENLAAIATGTKAVFAGGFASSASNVVDIYDSSANSWSTATLYDARNYLASTSVGTKAFFAGGMSSSSYPSYTIDIYDP